MFCLQPEVAAWSAGMGVNQNRVTHCTVRRLLVALLHYTEEEARNTSIWRYIIWRSRIYVLLRKILVDIIQPQCIAGTQIPFLRKPP